MSFESPKSNGISSKNETLENISSITINNTFNEKNQTDILNELTDENNFNNDNKIDNYIIGKKLGEGTFSKVYIGTHKKTKEKVAIKVMSKNQIKEESDKQRIIKEINIQKRCHHINIIQQYNIIETKTLIYIITEYASGGELFDYIVQKKKLYEIEACRFYNQIISGLEYLHKQRICHRDLKPENLLLDSNKILKIADFGLSSLYNKTNYKNNKLNTPCGSPCYAAPEMVSGKKYNGSSVDIWSSGIVLFTMVCGYLPFEDDNQRILFGKIARGIFSLPNFLSSSCRDLIKKILVTDPNKRFNFEDIKHHSWFNQCNLNLGKNIFFQSPGIFINEDVIPIDRDIVKEIHLKENIKIKDIVSLVIRNKHNDITTMYYLILNKKKKNKENSISDISHSSNQFLMYIKSSISKMAYWNNDINRIINYYTEQIDKYINNKKENEKLVDPAFNSEIKSILEENINEDLPVINLNTITNLHFNYIESNNGGNESENEIETKKEFESISQSKTITNSNRYEINYDTKTFENDLSNEPTVNSIHKMKVKDLIQLKNVKKKNKNDISSDNNNEILILNDNYLKSKSIENDNFKDKRTITEFEKNTKLMNIENTVENNTLNVIVNNEKNIKENGKKNIHNLFDNNWEIKRNIKKNKNNKNNNKNNSKSIDLKIQPLTSHYKKIPINKRNQIIKFINKKDNSEMENGIKNNNIIKKGKIRHKSILTEPNSIFIEKTIKKNNNRPKSVETNNIINNNRVKTDYINEKSNITSFYHLINKIRNVKYKNNLNYNNKKKKDFHSVSLDDSKNNKTQKNSKIKTIIFQNHKNPKSKLSNSIEKKTILNDLKKKIFGNSLNDNSNPINLKLKRNIEKYDKNLLLSSHNRNKHFSQEPSSYRESNDISNLVLKKHNGNSLILDVTSNEIMNKYKSINAKKMNSKKNGNLDKFLTKNNPNIKKIVSHNNEKKINLLTKNKINNNNNNNNNIINNKKITSYKQNFLLKEKEMEKQQKKLLLNTIKKPKDSK